MPSSTRQSSGVFIKPHHAEINIADVVGDWLFDLELQDVAPSTIASNREALLSFTKSLALHNLPIVLASLTDVNLKVWSVDLRLGTLENAKHRRGTLANPWMALRQAAIRTNLSVLKDFTKWLKGRYARVNLLQTMYVGHGIIEPLSQSDHATLLTACEGDSFDQFRARAFVRLLLAMACRFDELHSLTLDRIDLDSGRVWIALNTGRIVPLSIDSITRMHLQIYLGRRRLVAAPGADAVWLKDNGDPLTYWGAYAILLRLAVITGVDCNPRRFRYTVAQMANQRGFPDRPAIATDGENATAQRAEKYSLAGPSTSRVPTPPARKSTSPRPASGPIADSPAPLTPEWRGPGTHRW